MANPYSNQNALLNPSTDAAPQVKAPKKARFQDDVNADAKENLLIKSGRINQQDKRVRKISEEDDNMLTKSNYSGVTLKNEKQWKPPINVSYETLVLTSTTLNEKLRPAGFRSSGRHRQIKNTSMISKIRTRCRIRKQNPKLAVCITMYNEDEDELRRTLRGCLHNYNTLKLDPKTNFSKDDFLVVCVVDGYDRIPASFKVLAREKKFLDEEVLFQKGFMDINRDNEFKMKNIRDVMDPNVDPSKVPSNLLHCFQVTTWDFGIEQDILKGRRINFMFCIKQRNDGKINSHKWFFQAICKYLKPEYCLLLDIGTRPDLYAIQKLYNFMREHPQAGGVCGEIEIEFSPQASCSSFMVQAAQFYEYKLGHTPDKATESFFGFTSVLPGAYSVFRWKAIKGTPLDKFFKNVTRDETPTCAEANEYLAEDRIMCLQVYIKEETGYTVQYIPDAKAFTDGPQSLTVLMKQRRRWMNGALFGTYKVIANCGAMVSCGRNDHPFYRQSLMLLFMVYMITLYLLQFLTVGAMFVTVIIFFEEFFKQLAYTSEFLDDIYQNGILKKVIFSVYLGVIFLSVFVSISLPIDRAMPYFRVVSVILGVLMLSSIFGIIYFMTNSGGFEPTVKEKSCDDSGNVCTYVPVASGETYFSTLILAGTIMLCVYVLPMVMRPLDFLANFKSYIAGFIGYMTMMPVFTNVFQIYAMCNLHDVSWGNRPTSTGQEAFTANKADQAKSEADYKVFRTNFVLIWLAFNMTYYISIVEITSPGAKEGPDIIDSDSGYLLYFSMYLAALVVFRVTFATIYICKWKCRYNCSSKYKVKRANLQNEFKKIKSDTEDGQSTDDEFMEDEIRKVYEQNKEKIQHSFIESAHHMASEGQQETDVSKIQDATMLFMSKKGNRNNEDNDEDYDFNEFADADVEEAEDRVYSEYKKRQGHGEAVDENTIRNLAGAVDVSHMDQSIIMSAANGVYSRPPKLSRGGAGNADTSMASMLDLSAMMAMPEQRRNTKMQAMFEQTAQSQNQNQGNFKQMFKQLAPADEHANPNNDFRTDPDLMSSNHTGRSHERIESAQRVIRKNSGQDTLRQSKESMYRQNAKAMDPIQEDISQEQSRIQYSGDVDMPASKNQSDNSTGGGALADIFAQTDAEANVRQPPTRPGGAMAGIFEQTAQETRRNQKPY